MKDKKREPKTKLAKKSLCVSAAANWKVVFVGSVLLAILVVVALVVVMGTPQTESKFVGVWDKDGTEDWVEFRSDYTAVSCRKAFEYVGTWESVNATAIKASYIGAPNVVTYTLNADGTLSGWREDTYTKRGE